MYTPRVVQYHVTYLIMYIEGLEDFLQILYLYLNTRNATIILKAA